jgi:hypothetical protein
MSFPFVLAFGIGQKIPPFGLFKIEYRKNGFLSTQKHLPRETAEKRGSWGG